MPNRRRADLLRQDGVERKSGRDSPPPDRGREVGLYPTAKDQPIAYATTMRTSRNSRNLNPAASGSDLMDSETDNWSRRYLTELRRYLKLGGKASLAPALRLGRRAATLKMETLDVVKIHEEAVKALPASDTGQKTKGLHRAREFFAEVIVPIEQTHPAAQQAELRVKQLEQKLRLRTREATEKNRHLERTVVQRQAAEEALKRSAAHRDKLLAEAQRLQTQLRRMMRQIEAAKERERKKTGRQLDNETAQTLLAIHMRLAMLKTASRDDTENLQKEIDESQRLVDDLSVKIDFLNRIFENINET